MTATATCVGAGEHLAPVSEHAQEIAWYGATKDGARPVRWTCPCCPGGEYELCVLGAVWFIRRTGRGTHETLRDTRAATEQVWWLLVAGGAR